ncbi:hypothetical protein C0992_011284 [Termitomyces sp. T32_za158]|nr:hypothetical protein C0992_011284 [Termitomyces sp. T32_za158]
MTPGSPSPPFDFQSQSPSFVEAVQNPTTDPLTQSISSGSQASPHVLDESTQKQTIIESEDAYWLNNDKNTSQPKETNRLSMKEEENTADLGSDEKDCGEMVYPLRTLHEVHETIAPTDDGDITDTVVDNAESQLDKKASFKRASHLNLKTLSHQPWDLVDPPDTDDSQGHPDYYTTLGSNKIKTLQVTAHSRPLIPKSSYYFGPPPAGSAFYSPPVGQIGLHHPREIIRIERDYTGGELIQFAPIFPVELEGRITPTHFLESINAINELLISAHSLRHSFLDNTLAVLTLQLSRLFITSHYHKASTGALVLPIKIPDMAVQEMQKLQQLVDTLNVELYNPAGLNILWPQNVAFLYLEIEYYGHQ